MIPRIIHQTWKNENIPENWLHAYNSCKDVNVGYKHILWTDKTMKEFMKKNFPEFVKMYN